MERLSAIEQIPKWQEHMEHEAFIRLPLPFSFAFRVLFSFHFHLLDLGESTVGDEFCLSVQAVPFCSPS